MHSQLLHLFFYDGKSSKLIKKQRYFNWLLYFSVVFIIYYSCVKLIFLLFYFYLNCENVIKISIYNICMYLNSILNSWSSSFTLFFPLKKHFLIQPQTVAFLFYGCKYTLKGRIQRKCINKKIN